MPIARCSALRSLRVWPRALPANSMTPLSGVSSPLMQRKSVLLPEPLAPMIATTSPASISSVTSCRTWCVPKALEMAFNAKIGIDAPFEGLGQQRQRPAEDEIEQRDDRINDHRFEGRVGHQLAGAGQLDEADDRGDRGALDQLDHEADGRRDRDARRLRQVDVPKLLGEADREAFGGLPLRPRDRLDRAAPDLAEKGAGIEGEGEQHRRPGIDLEIEEDGDAVINDEELHQHRGALEALDIAGGEPA